MGNQLPLPQKGAQPPIFGPCLLWLNGPIPLGMEAGLGPDNIVPDGKPAPPPQKGGRAPPPQFSAVVYCAQTAGCIKMPLGTEVVLERSYIELD